MGFYKKLLKTILKKVFGSFSSIVYDRAVFLFRKLRGGYFSLNNLDRKLEKYVNYDNGFFVELD